MFMQVSRNAEAKKNPYRLRFLSHSLRCKMSDGAIVQYRGFEVKLLVREYTFNVREAGSEREFTLSIENEAFVSHRVRYQDAPSICSMRLTPELLAHSPITSREMETFRVARTQKPPPSPYAGKPLEDY